MKNVLSPLWALFLWASARALAAGEEAPRGAAFAAGVEARIPAFPGAEGYGAWTTGGRSGKVLEVTNLNDAGPGSLRAAIEAQGPRTVVFRVAGTIELAKRLAIKNGDLTIAGQSAPGGGICLRNYDLSFNGAQNVIVRYLRMRLGPASGDGLDAAGGVGGDSIILDHCSLSWSVDETLSLYHCRNLSVQWCLIAESLYRSVHPKGAHGYGGIWGGTDSTYHHNLFAHHTSRNPRFDRDLLNTDFRNNVIYNWGFNSSYGGERSAVNIVNNFYKPGPATLEKVRDRVLDASAAGGHWFVEGNVVDGSPELDADNWQGAVQRPWGRETDVRVHTSFPAAFVTTQPAREAYEAVLAGAGALLPQRDALDQRIVEETRTGTARFGASFGSGGNGIIDTPEEVGGWPELAAGVAPKDSDHDGMPDEWELHYGLDPHSGADAAMDLDGDGYTNLEEYLNATDPTKGASYQIARMLPTMTVKPGAPALFFRHEIVVAADGTGDVKTVQAAIDLAPEHRTAPFMIRLKPGVYEEHVLVPAGKPFLVFEGASSPEKVVIRFNQNLNSTDAAGNKISTQESATVMVRAAHFSAHRVTFENSTGVGIQPLAFYLEADEARFNECRFLGWQDTLRLEGGRSLFRHCLISGAVDFIYGSGTAYFEKCAIYCAGNGYITAPSTPDTSAFGFVFRDCQVSAAPEVKWIYLGRPWRPFGASTWIGCELPAAVRADGWENWRNPANETTARFSESASTGEGANAGKRVKWAKALDAPEKLNAKAVLGWE